MVQWRVRMDLFDEFSNLFRAGIRLRVSFPEGSEEPWVASLQGSPAAYTNFARCIVVVSGNGADPGPSQPFGAVPRTAPRPGSQPYGGTAKSDAVGAGQTGTDKFQR